MLLGRKNILYSFIVSVFSIVSFFIMIFSIVKSDNNMWLLLPLLYIFPKTVSSVNDIQNISYTIMETILNMIASAVGAIIIIISLVILSTIMMGDETSTSLKICMIALSSFFVLKEVYCLVHEFVKYVNLHKQIESSDSLKEK